MSIEVKPMGHACNLSCGYCYQEPMRLAGSKNPKIDIDNMLRHLDRLKHDFSVFGGEPLLTPKKYLRKLFAYGFAEHKKNGIQTNGLLIDDDHIRMFKEFNVNVGVSIDGPNELNSLRTIRGKEDEANATVEATRTIMKNIQKMKGEGINVTVIITLHRQNGTPDRLPRLMEFITWLGQNGVNSGNIHSLEVDSTMRDAQKEVLTEEENIAAMLDLARYFEEKPDLYYVPFRTMKEAMTGDDQDSNCIWQNCDSMNTSAVYGIESDGGVSNCGRTNKEGINWHKADDSGFERYISLYNTPQEIGGCKGCPYFSFCGGGCPGESFDGDFRNKTMYCGTHKALYSFYENVMTDKGETPFTQTEELKQVENVLVEGFLRGNGLKVVQARKLLVNRKKDEERRMREAIQKRVVFQVPVFKEGDEVPNGI